MDGNPKISKTRLGNSTTTVPQTMLYTAATRKTFRNSNSLSTVEHSNATGGLADPGALEENAWSERSPATFLEEQEPTRRANDQRAQTLCLFPTTRTSP